MKAITFLSLLLLNCAISFSQNSLNGTWKSSYSDLQLKFDNNWKLINPELDSEDTTLVGLTDPKDHSSITVKISEDVSKEKLSNEAYNNAVKEQMLKANPENKFIVQDEIDFKEKKYTRQIFLMKIKYGDFILICYIHRDGKKMTSLQLSYPENINNNPEQEIPKKIDKVLLDMNI